jgi:hypothetical protein
MLIAISGGRSDEVYKRSLLRFRGNNGVVGLEGA